MPDFRPILFTLGALLLLLAIAMLLPAAVEALQHQSGWRAFLVSAVITGGAGGALMLAYRLPDRPTFTPRQGFLLVTLTWIVLCAFATLPLMLSAPHLSFTDAYFEAMSGLTTTGSTVIVGLAEQPKGLLLWRAMLSWIGGAGIIVMAVALLPMLRVGGMQLFRMESSDKSEKVRPRVSQVSGVILSVYVTLTAICAVALVIAGMNLFDAVCHAMATIATGGFSNEDASLGAYDNPAAEWIIALFMLLGGCTFVLLARIAQGDLRSFVNDSQTRWYFGYLAVFIAVIAAWQIVVDGRPPIDVLLQVNISGEATKSGVAPAEVEALAGAVARLPGLRLRGLMAIPEPEADAELQRAPLLRMKQLFDRLRGAGLQLDTLSLGMSADLEAAIAAGSTMVRIGTAIFGERGKQQA